jgi:hypothetical protein
VVAYNVAGNSTSAPVGGPRPMLPVAPTTAVATLQAGPQIRLAWRDNSGNETYFRVEPSVDGGAFALIGTPAVGSTSFVDMAVAAAHAYRYRVAAVNVAGQSGYATSGTVTLAAPPMHRRVSLEQRLSLERRPMCR